MITAYPTVMNESEQTSVRTTVRSIRKKPTAHPVGADFTATGL